MKKPNIFSLITIVILVIFAFTARYMPRQVVIWVLLGVLLLYTVRIILSARRAAAGFRDMSRMEKVSAVVFYVAAIGSLIALALAMLHHRALSRPLLNGSLILFMVGSVIGMLAPPRANEAAQPKKIPLHIARRVMYLFMIIMVAGLQMRINHYPGGKQVTWGGMISFLFFAFIFAYINKSKKEEKV